MRPQPLPLPDVRLPRPLDCVLGGAAAGWERLYPYGTVFSQAQRGQEEEAFWFHDGLH